MGDRFGIELDYCPQCRGIWLEKGKLDRIVERSPAAAAPAAPTQQAVRPEYPDGYRDHDHDHHDEHGYEHDRYGRRKKSFLSGLFD